MSADCGVILLRYDSISLKMDATSSALVRTPVPSLKYLSWKIIQQDPLLAKQFTKLQKELVISSCSDDEVKQWNEWKTFIGKIISIILDYGIIFGGFVRDFIRGVPFNDIDVLINTKCNFERLVHVLQCHGFRVSYNIAEEEKYFFEVVKVLVRSNNDDNVEVKLDIVRGYLTNMKKDFDVNLLIMWSQTKIGYYLEGDSGQEVLSRDYFGTNVCITAYEGLDLNIVIEHIHKRNCVYLGCKSADKFYPRYFTDNETKKICLDKTMMQDRIDKMQSRGWTICNIESCECV